MRKNRIFTTAAAFTQAFVLTLACGVGQAMALTGCNSEGNTLGHTPATATQIATVLNAVGNAACMNSNTCTGIFAVSGSGADSNHEVIVGSATNGTVYDKKLGAVAKDPAGAVGTYTITTPNGSYGNIEYTDPSGGSAHFTFCVYGASYASGATGTYTFWDGTTPHSITLQNGD